MPIGYGETEVPCYSITLLHDSKELSESPKLSMNLWEDRSLSIKSLDEHSEGCHFFFPVTKK